MSAYVVTVKGGTILVDECDVALACEPGWMLNGKDYVYRSARRIDGVRKPAARLHRLISAAPAHSLVDHIDGNPLNNTRANLRACTAAQSSANRHAVRRACASCYKGVVRGRGGRKWAARITVHGKPAHLGRFYTEEGAARAYDEAARQHFGEFARLNFPRPGEQPALREDSNVA